MLPGNVQCAWPHPSAPFLYVASSDEAPLRRRPPPAVAVAAPIAPVGAQPRAVDIRFAPPRCRCRWPIVRALRTLVRRTEFDERVRLIEREELALANFAYERLPGQRRRTNERPERRLGRLPAFDDVGGEIFRVAGEIKPANCRPRLIECGEGGALLRSCHVPGEAI